MNQMIPLTVILLSNNDCILIFLYTVKPKPKHLVDFQQMRIYLPSKDDSVVLGLANKKYFENTIKPVFNVPLWKVFSNKVSITYNQFGWI